MKKEILKLGALSKLNKLMESNQNTSNRFDMSKIEEKMPANIRTIFGKVIDSILKKEIPVA